jgi:hypothetical protein
MTRGRTERSWPFAVLDVTPRARGVSERRTESLLRCCDSMEEWKPRCLRAYPCHIGDVRGGGLDCVPPGDVRREIPAEVGKVLRTAYGNHPPKVEDNCHHTTSQPPVISHSYVVLIFRPVTHKGLVKRQKSVRFFEPVQAKSTILNSSL